MRRRRSALALGILLTVAAAGLWLAHPWPHAAGSVQITSCRLPVYLSNSNIGGFVTVPGYAFTAAPANTFSAGAKGADKHWSYDAAIGRWVPVDHRLISPDGSWWVYGTPLEPSISASLHLVDRHGADRIVWTGTGRAIPLGWTAGGAVFVHVGTSAQFQTEYLLIDPATGKQRSLAPIAGEAVGANTSGLWATRNLVAGLDSDKNPPLHATILRTDVNTGETVTWWDQTISALVFILGFDANGHPILAISDMPERYVLLESPTNETEITGDARAAELVPVSALGDSRGIWFGDVHGAIWLWNASQGLKPVAWVSTAATEAVVIAGPCR
jgi:hypothetical protein